MKKITSLIPIPGSKRAKKYDFLQPLPFQKTICTPFMGGAAKELKTCLRAIVGESNAALRDIAQAPKYESSIINFVREYQSALAYMVEDFPIDKILPYASVKQSQKQLRKYEPELAEILDFRWKTLCEKLWNSLENGESCAGLYMFCVRACFGNVMRMNPKQTAFNVSWHVDKLRQALQFNPQFWCDSLVAQKWNPEIYPSWEQAIEAVDNVPDTWLFLDPPYIEQEGDRKMTPCYMNHFVTTEARENTFRLATDSLELGCKRGFLKIDLCNYYSDRLNDVVYLLADLYDYSVEMTTVGVCGALGNSNGRMIHGERRDLRERPIEVVWTLKSLF